MESRWNPYNLRYSDRMSVGYKIWTLTKRNKKLQIVERKEREKDIEAEKAGLKRISLTGDIDEDEVLEACQMGFYTKKVLGTTLQEAIEANLNAPVADQMSLLEELAIVREIASENVGFYANAISNIERINKAILVETSETEKEKKQAELQIWQGMKLKLGEEAIAALSKVSDFCSRAAHIDSLQRDKFSIHAINSVINQLCHICRSVFDLNGVHHLAVEFERQVREKLVIPAAVTSASVAVNNAANNVALGTTLTPDKIDETVKLMDDLTIGEVGDDKARRI